MKSRKLKAILAALSAVAVMATAMTGFAAATTTYDATTGKVIVTETVTADANSEVTYLVKSNNQIVYIDQATANESGTATFSYKIAGEKLAADLSTTATFGTDGAKAVTDGSAALALYGYTDVNAETYTIDYDKTMSGSDDYAVATITAVEGYEIESITIGGVAQAAPFAKSYEVTKGVKVEVTTKLAYVAPTINAEETVVGTMEDDTSLDDGKTYKAITTVISYTGDFTDGAIGVICGDYYYPAKVAKDGKAAVKLILPEGSKDVTVKAYANVE